MNAKFPYAPWHGERGRPKGGGGDSRFTPRPPVSRSRELSQRRGCKFRRRHPIGPYIAEFSCLTANFVIEMNGFVHGIGDRPARDIERDRFISENGFWDLRISASRVLADQRGAAALLEAGRGDLLQRPVGGPIARTGEGRK
ncbi:MULTISPECIES: DUF559 domain-containing protein [unclassified Novosphingobium]|uniref:endonuclease domain-containing protein n=1 Tax=unclassified Novosphingobium TaxID=2644732 RepID=UPI001358F979